MKDLHFNSLYDLQEFLGYLKEISSGSESTCYLFHKSIIKYLDGPEAIMLPLEEAIQFKNIEIESFIFTQAVIFIKDKVVGYIMPFVQGKTLFDKSVLEYDLSEMMNACTIALNDIHLLSQEQILMFDVMTPNIMCNNNRFYFIDTNNYSFSKDNEVDLFNNNISQFSKAITANIIDDKTLLNFVRKTPTLKNIINEVDLLRNPSDILKLLRQELIPYCGSDFKTLQQASKTLSLK